MSSRLSAGGLSARNRQRLADAALWLGVAGFLVLLSSAFLQALSWRSAEGLYVMVSGACYASAVLLLGRAVGRALLGTQSKPANAPA